MLKIIDTNNKVIATLTDEDTEPKFNESEEDKKKKVRMSTQVIKQEMQSCPKCGHIFPVGTTDSPIT